MRNVMMDLDEIKQKAHDRMMDSARRAARKGNLAQAVRLYEGAQGLSEEIEDPLKRRREAVHVA